MDLEWVRLILVIVGASFQWWAAVLMWRDRSRRERETRVRPQPLQQTPRSRVVTTVGAVAWVGAAATFIPEFL